MMRVFTVQFDYGNRDMYARQLRAFRNSVRANSPNWEFINVCVPPPKVSAAGRKAYHSNTLKLQIWRDIVAEEKDLLLLADCDMIDLLPLDPVAAMPFDIAFTRRDEFDHRYGPEGPPCWFPRNGEITATRMGVAAPDDPAEMALDDPRLCKTIQSASVAPPLEQLPRPCPSNLRGNGVKVRVRGKMGVRHELVGSRMVSASKGSVPASRRAAHTRAGIPYNGGIVFVRPNDYSRAFINRWMGVNDEMLADPVFHGVWRDSYAGMNQAAFGYMMEREPGICDMLSLRCSEWNGCDQSWRHIGDERPRVLHVKSKLRKMALGIWPTRKGFEKAVQLWRYYETLDKK